MAFDTYLRAGDGIASPVLADGAATYNYGSGLTSEVRGGTSKFYQADALGSTRELTNSSGTVTDAHETDAFGNTVAASGSTPTPFGFAGQAGYQSDSDTGLKLLGHRYYDSSTGRFISRDPIKDGHNWYTYCDNDPVNRVDVTGLFVEEFVVSAAIIEAIEEGAVAGSFVEPGLGTLAGAAAGLVAGLVGAALIHAAVTPDEAPKPGVGSSIGGDEPAPSPAPSTDGAGARKPPNLDDRDWRFHYSDNPNLGGQDLKPGPGMQGVSVTDLIPSVSASNPEIIASMTGKINLDQAYLIDVTGIDLAENGSGHQGGASDEIYPGTIPGNRVYGPNLDLGF